MIYCVLQCAYVCLMNLNKTVTVSVMAPEQGIPAAKAAQSLCFFPSLGGPRMTVNFCPLAQRAPGCPGCRAWWACEPEPAPSHLRQVGVYHHDLRVWIEVTPEIMPSTSDTCQHVFLWIDLSEKTSAKVSQNIPKDPKDPQWLWQLRRLPRSSSSSKIRLTCSGQVGLYTGGRFSSAKWL